MDERDLYEAAAPLIALARISQQTGSAGSIASSRDALPLLEQLLALCSAERGALLLPREFSIAQAVASLPAHAPMGGFRTLAKLGMSEEDILPLLMAFASTGADVQTPADARGWTLCRLPLAAAATRADELAGPSPAVPFSLAPFPVDALLVLGWDATEQKPSFDAVEKGRALLPFMVDVAGVTLTNLLLFERLSEQETVMKQRVLHERQVLQTELLVNVSHELRSPLTSIKGYAETLLRMGRRTSRKDHVEFLVAINEASNNLAVVIDRLLEMAQLDAGIFRIERSPVNLARLIRETLSTAEQHLGATKQRKSTCETQEPFTFSLRLEDLYGEPMSAEPLIQADRHRLKEVLDHLLENAILYSPRGGIIEVTIRPLTVQGLAERLQSLRRAPKSGETKDLPSSHAQKSHQGVEVCIRDQGMGIAAEHLEQIFERFHRLDTKLTRRVDGLGLGLAICKRIVELHDGMIWAESEVGEGSVFHVWLPTAVQM